MWFKKSIKHVAKSDFSQSLIIQLSMRFFRICLKKWSNSFIFPPNKSFRVPQKSGIPLIRMYIEAIFHQMSMENRDWTSKTCRWRKFHKNTLGCSTMKSINFQHVYRNSGMKRFKITLQKFMKSPLLLSKLFFMLITRNQNGRNSKKELADLFTFQHWGLIIIQRKLRKVRLSRSQLKMGLN